MGLTNINRYFLHKKVLRKINKKQDYKVSPTDLMILMGIIHCPSRHPKVTQTNLRKFLHFNGHDVHWLNLSKQLKQLHELGLIDKAGDNYSLSPLGLLRLQQIERRWKAERYDY